MEGQVEMHDGVRKFSKLLSHAQVGVRDGCKYLLGVSRPTYYGWLKGASPRKGRMARIDAANRVLARAIKSGKLPVSDEIVGKERRTTGLRIIADQINALKTE